MTSYKDWAYDHGVPAFCCLERANKRLEEFDQGTTESLFYAALELRMGIEARINEYIEATLRSQKREKQEIEHYSATKLLKYLASLDPNALEPATLVFYPGNQKVGTGFKYTPVTPKLAKFHGMLGEILHYRFFKKNEHWYYKKRLKDEHGVKSLLDFRDFLEEVYVELKEANKGTLLAHPSFTRLMEKGKECERNG